MQKILLLTLLIKTIISKSAQKSSNFTDSSIFKNYSKFLNINFQKQIKPSQKDSKHAFCISNKKSIYKDYSGRFYDTGIISCDWEIDLIEIRCNGDFVKKIYLKMRNFKNNNKKYLNGDNTFNIDGMLKIPENLFVEEIHNVFFSRELGEKFLLGILFFFNNGKKKYLGCNHHTSIYDDFLKIEKNRFSKLTRITGFVSLSNKNKISDLQFYLHVLKGEKKEIPQNLEFSDVVKNYRLKYLSSNEKVNKLKSVGFSSLTKFKDKKINTSWNLKKIIIFYKENNILSLQSFFKHYSFKIPMINKKHSVFNFAEIEGYKKIEIFVNNSILKIDIQKNKIGNICGILIYFENGGKSKNFCGEIQKTKTFEISKNDHFIGFYGSFSFFGLNSLGLMLRGKREFFIGNDFRKL